jgi:uncharacterized phage-associated protein
MSAPTDASNKSERLKEAVMAALQAVGGRMQIVNLNKALFYADLIALYEFGETITGQEYLAFPLGPVVTGYERRIVKALERDGLAKQEVNESGYGKPLVVVHAMSAFPHIRADMLKIIEDIAKEAAKKEAGDLSHFSHDNPGWILARKKTEQANGQAQPINMRFALQQLAGEEEWMRSKTLTAEEEAAVLEAESATGEDWGS